MELTEELNNFNTDLKELFVKMEYEEMKLRLGERTTEERRQLIECNQTIVEKYFREGRLDLIRKFITFVAYSSFLAEYGMKQGILPDGEDPMELYQEIFEALRGESETQETE